MGGLLNLPEFMGSVEARVARASECPIDFETFLDISFERDLDFELVNGVMVEKMSAQLPHERLRGWLYPVAAVFAEQRDLGIVLGSRTAVEINAYRGRLPDLLFVRQERADIVRERAVYGAPDLVVKSCRPMIAPPTSLTWKPITAIWA